MDDLERAMREAEDSMRGGLNDIPVRLADRVGSRAAATAVFGAPVERDGVTVIPVARVAWGVGGGGGKGTHEHGEGEGSGGGGGAMASPAGYIELSCGTAAHKSIGSPVSPAPLLAAAVSAWCVLRGLPA